MVPRKSNEKSEGEKEIKMWFPKTLSYGQDLLGGVLLLLIQRGERRRAGGGGGGGRVLWEAGGFCRFNRNAPMPDCREPGRSGGPWSASWQWPPAGSKGGRVEGAGAGDPVASYLPLPRLASANSGAYTAVQRDRAELLASQDLDLPSMAR